ncbi:MAG TPA: efflux transporter outer membrane subunit [Candidatus Udaeobacter sp.]|nr:efflux transporter outer membrane subunit [Candidatus Udaeobacter sp.]
MKIRELAITVALSVALSAGGCSVGPNYKKPEVKFASEWAEAKQSGVDGRPAELTRWWTSFNDPLLNSLVERAVRSNLDLRQAEARIREARAVRALTAAGEWPTVDVATSYTRNRSSENAFAISPQTGGASPGLSGKLDQNFYKAGFDASWEIDVFGGVRRSVEAADATIEATVEDRRAALVTLLGDVARNYIDLRGFQHRIEVAQANLKAQQETLDLTRVRFQAGLASDLEVAQAEGQLNTTAAQIPTLESLLKQSAHRLDVLLGSQPGALADELSPTAPIPALPPEVLVGLPSELLRRRPDIRSAERQLAAATAQVGAATADLFPKFSLTGAAGLQSISAGDWFTGRSRFWSIGPTVRWPIFDAGRIRANIEVRNAQQEQALTQYEKTILTAFEDVENSLVSYSREQARYRSLSQAVAANRRAVEMSNELYTRGLVDFLNVLENQRALYASENDLAQSEAAMASNLVSLYKALGGGWDID